MFELKTISECESPSPIWDFGCNLQDYGLFERVFYGGIIMKISDMCLLFSNVDIVFGFQDGELCGAIWIQRTEHRVGRLHFVSFPPFDMKEAESTIKEYLQSKLDRNNKECYSIIIGITPYQAVARYFRRWGFSDPVKLPDYHYDFYKQCYVPCWQVFLTIN